MHWFHVSVVEFQLTRAHYYRNISVRELDKLDCPINFRTNTETLYNRTVHCFVYIILCFARLVHLQCQ